MNHQPYESWILDEEKINRSQQIELEEHLKECPKCSTLQNSWTIARSTIRSAPVVQPKAGFAERWQRSLAERKKAEEHRLTRNLILWLSGSALLIMIILAVIFSPDFSLISLTVSAITILVNVAVGISALGEFVMSFVRSAPPAVLIITALFFSTLISVVCFIWGISLWKVSLKGVDTNEKS